MYDTAALVRLISNLAQHPAMVMFMAKMPPTEYDSLSVLLGAARYDKTWPNLVENTNKQT